MTAEIHFLTKAIMAHRERRQPQFKPVNETIITDDASNEIKSPFKIYECFGVLMKCCLICYSWMTLDDAEKHGQICSKCGNLQSDNIRISSIRPWQPEDDGDPAA